MAKEGLPPGVKQVLGGYIREKVVTSEDGSTRIQKKPVALTLEEAKAKRMDFYHPDLGWIVEGYKLEKDREPIDVMADSSSAMPDPKLFPTKI